MYKSRPQRTYSILFVTMVIIVLATLITSAMFTILLVHYRTKDIIDKADSKLLMADEFSREIIGPEYHDTIDDKASVPEKQFHKIVARNDDLCRRMNLQYLWSVLLVNESLVFTSATHSDLNDPNSPCAAFFEKHRDPGAFAPAMRQGLNPFYSSFKNEWGEGRMVLIPRRDARGRVYIFGASMQLTELNAMVRRTAMVSLGISLAIICVSFCIAVLLARSFAAPVASLTDAADRMATGDLDAFLPSLAISEFESLSRSLNRMRQGLKMHMSMLQKSEEKYRALFEQSAAGVALIESRTGRFIEINRKFCEIAGYTKEELMQSTFQNITHPEDLQADLVNMQKLLAGEVKNFSMEKRYIGKNGTIVWVNLEVAPLRSDDGAFDKHIAIVNDITPRKQAEEALAEVNSRFKQILDSFPYGIYIVNAACDIEYINPALVREFGPTEGRKCHEYFHDLPERCRWCQIEQVQRGEVAQGEWYSPKNKREYELYHVPLYNQNATTSKMTVFRDITEYKQAVRELEAKNEELIRYTYTISHDLRSPLVTIRTFLGHLAQDMVSGEETHIAQDMEFLNTASKKMAAQLDELLELSRIGRIVNPPVEISLGDIVQEVLGLLAGPIEQRGVPVRVTGGDAPLYGDRARLVQVVQNLLENAIKFMGGQAAPLVEIGAKNRNGGTECFVRDNGMGIDPRHIGKLFGLFEKLDVKSEGVGMGLAMVKRIVEAHGGRAWAESEGVGKGDCFWLTLPGKNPA